RTGDEELSDIAPGPDEELLGLVERGDRVADEHREHRPDADAGGPDEGDESIDEPGCGRDGQSDRERVEPEVALEDAEPGLHDQSQSHTADGAVDERADRAHPPGADAHAGEHTTDDSADGQGQTG